MDRADDDVVVPRSATVPQMPVPAIEEIVRDMPYDARRYAFLAEQLTDESIVGYHQWYWRPFVMELFAGGQASALALVGGNANVNWKALLDAYLYVYRHLTVELQYEPYSVLRGRGKMARFQSHALFPSVASDSWTSKTFAASPYAQRVMPVRAGSFDGLFSAVVRLQFVPPDGEFSGQLLFEASYSSDTTAKSNDVFASGTWFFAELLVDPELPAVRATYLMDEPLPLSTVMRLYSDTFPDRSFTLTTPALDRRRGEKRSIDEISAVEMQRPLPSLPSPSPLLPGAITDAQLIDEWFTDGAKE